ncbi:MAG: hypothetical protein K1000chlam1_00243 [Candidatus Anoxychlamydiales bacterium]|nr:hypothetical protein [Candidatus Anoxychlamydiales bacterium]
MFKILKKWIIGFLVFLNASIFALNVNFSDPTSTPFGTPDLSDSNENAVDSQITTDNSGRYVYAIWKRDDGTVTYVIQTTTSRDFGSYLERCYGSIRLEPNGYRATNNN